MTRGRAILALAGAWIAVGLGAGTVEWITVYAPRGIPWTVGVRGPLTAGVIWIPLTLGALAVVRRRPVVPVTRGSAALHLALAAASSFALNVTFNVLYHVAGWGWGTFGVMMADAFRSGLQLIHLNAGAYLAIVIIASLVLQRRSQAPAPGSSAAPPKALAVRTGNDTTLVPVEDVDWIEGAGDYARLHVGERQYLLGERLKQLETRLDPTAFARVHRSAIVNVSRLRRLQHRSHGDYDAVLADGTEIRVSRTYRAALGRFLEGGQGGQGGL